MEAAERREMCMEFLRSEGHQPEMKPDGWILFKHDGYPFVVNLEDEDEAFFRLIMPCIWSVSSEEERKHALLACNDINTNYKLVRANVDDDDVHVDIELMLPRPDDAKTILQRGLEILHGGREYFVDQMELKLGLRRRLSIVRNEG